MIYLLVIDFVVLAVCSTIIANMALNKLDTTNQKTISFIVAQDKHDLKLFRAATISGILALVIAVMLFIVPTVEYSLFFTISYIVIYISAFMLSLIPDTTGTDIFKYSLHNLFAWIVGLGVMTTTAMLGLALEGTASYVEFGLLALMLLLSTAAIVNRSSFVFYELIFILASHLSVFVAAIALY